LQELIRTGHAVYSISYDPVEVLSSFATRYGVEYDLLSDPGSETIEQLGLLNEHVREQQTFFGREVKDRHNRLPHPGTFILDEDGIVVSKTFDDSYRDRPSSDYLLTQSIGSDDRAAYETTARDQGVSIRAWVAEHTYRPLQKEMLHLRLDLAEDHHVYVPPVPNGFQPLEVEIAQSDRVMSWTPDLPAGRPHTVTGLDERFHVVDGTIELAVPFKVSGPSHDLDGREREHPLSDGAVTLDVVLRYQVCTTDACLPPSERRLAIPLAEGALVR
jgi:hypothetical protein